MNHSSLSEFQSYFYLQCFAISSAKELRIQFASSTKHVASASSATSGHAKQLAELSGRGVLCTMTDLNCLQ